MILKIFTIYDVKAGAYLPPFYLPQEGMATRTFQDCVNDENHAFSKNPGDYTLMSLGQFDDVKGISKSHPPKSIGNGLEFIQYEKEENQGELELPILVEKSNSEDKRT